MLGYHIFRKLASFVPRILSRMGSQQEFSSISLSLMFQLFHLMFPPLFLNHCYFLLSSPSKSILCSHYISNLLLDVQVLSSYPPFRSLLSLLCVTVFSLLLSCVLEGGYSRNWGTDLYECPSCRRVSLSSRLRLSLTRCQETLNLSQSCSPVPQYPSPPLLLSSIWCSLAVVENLRGKSKGEFVLSFSESVGLHPIVPQKKIPMNWAWGIFFTAL